MGKGNPAAHEQVIERRGVVISAIGILAGCWWDAAIDGMAMASEFTDSNSLFTLFHYFSC